MKFHKGKCLEVRQTQEYSSSPAVSNDHSPAATTATQQEQQQLQAHQQQSQQQQAESLQYPEYQADIVHMTFKSFSSPYKYRDVVLLRCFAHITKTQKEFETQGFRHRQNTPSTLGGAVQTLP